MQFLSQVEEILWGGGYVPVVVSDAVSAVEAVVQNKPDVILLDLRMASKNGFELTDSINQAIEPRKVPVIATADFFKEEFDWLNNLCGIKRWIIKPVRPLDLIWAIENEIGESTQSAGENHFAGIDSIQR